MHRALNPFLFFQPQPPVVSVNEHLTFLCEIMICCVGVGVYCSIDDVVVVIPSFQQMAIDLSNPTITTQAEKLLCQLFSFLLNR